MKKLISILLAVLMVFSVMPLNALAEDIQVSSDSVFDTEQIGIPTKLDYTAFDSAVKLVNELDTTPYTEESVKALKDSVADRSTLTTQSKINSATTAIMTAYNNLVKKTITVNFSVVDSSDNMSTKSSNYAYGDEVELNVTDTDEVATKWIMSTDEADIKLDVQGNSYSFVVTQNVEITAFTDAKPEAVEQFQKVKFLAINGKVIDIIYTLDVNDVEMPTAPSVPFYIFDEWEKLDETTYQARYTLDPLCDGEHHTFYVETINPGCDTVGYLIFRCECGEAYSTEYVRPTGHRYEEDAEYCLNGCGKHNPNLEDESNSTVEPTTPAQPEEPTTKPNDTDNQIGFDEGGYNNMVIAP